MITIQELLFNRGLDKTAKIKLVRHKESGEDIFHLYKTDKPAFLDYQNRQQKNIFGDLDYIVSFVGETGKTARFIGVFKVLGFTVRHDESCPFVYDMIEVEGFDDLKERVIIHWNTPISWHQYIQNKMEVIEIHAGLHYRQFTDYLDFILTFEELQSIVQQGYADWKRMLSAVKGIYLIHDNSDGKLYVGSAYGDTGIWGRWQTYVQTGGHGNNKQLIELIQQDSKRAKSFEFSILMILPKTITAEEAIKKEQLFKNKLGSKAFGLNLN